MKIFAIIVTYNGMCWIKNCLNSLLESTIPVEIIVVDNNSSDETVSFIQNKYSTIRLIESEENLGFGRANNIGINYALKNGADYVFLLNQDAWIAENTIEKLISISQENKEYGIISPIHLNKEKNHIEKLLLERLSDRFTTNEEFLNDLYLSQVKDIYETKYVNAASWFLPRKTIELIGGFDPIFYHYGEDDNYLNRVIYHGLKIGICPKLAIVHDNDRPRPLYDNNENEILLLIEYTNINKRINVKRDICGTLGKIITSAIKMRFSRSISLIHKLIFLVSHKKSLENSRIQNTQLGKNWL